MKKEFIVLLLSVILQLPDLHAQHVPYKFNFSGIATDGSNGAVSNQAVSIRLSILQSAPNGALSYQETHTALTDAQGLFSLVVGEGAIQSGDLQSLAWDTDKFFLQLDMDINGGSAYETISVTQLLSVPYAMHAAIADSLITAWETDPVFSDAVAFHVSAADTVTWNQDTDPANELQQLSIHEDTLFLTGGGFAKLPSMSLPSSFIQPAITTFAPADISSHGAVLKGEMGNIDASEIIEMGFLIDTVSSPAPDLTKKFRSVTATGIYELNLLDSIRYLLKPGKSYFVRSYVITQNKVTFYGNESALNTIPVGQTGPAGGTVFFTKADASGGWQHLEIRYPNIGSYPWGCWGTVIGGTLPGIGTGASNTNAIVNGCSDLNIAAKKCDELVANGYSDWFLPSLYESMLIYKSLGYTNIVTSTQLNQYSFSNVSVYGTIEEVEKSTYLTVRAIRKY